MSDELAGNLIQRIRDDSKECIDNHEGCSTSTNHQLENEDEESTADKEDDHSDHQLENVDEESIADLDRQSSSQRDQDVTEDSMECTSLQSCSRDGEDYDKGSEKVFTDFLKEVGLDDSVLDLPGFKNWVYYLNPAVKIPTPSSKNKKLDVPKTDKSSRKLSVGERFAAITARIRPELNINKADGGESNSSSSVSSDAIENFAERKEMMERNAKKIEDSAESKATDSSDEDDETEVADYTDADNIVPGESERVKELLDRTAKKEPVAPGLTPCLICGNNVTSNKSITMTANETIKALMAAVHCKKIEMKVAEAAVCNVRLKMCNTHHDDVYKWMCKAIGVKTANDVDPIPGIDLFDVLTVYRRLKGIRDAYENRNPSNTPVGSFKMAIKSYFRNYVPRKQGIVRSVEAIKRIVKEDPACHSFGKALQPHTTQAAPASSKLPKTSTFASNITASEHQQGRRSARLEKRYKDMPGVVGKVLQPIEAVYEKGDVLQKEVCSQDDEQIVFESFRKSDPTQLSLHPNTPEPDVAASSNVPEKSTSASSDTVSKNQQGRRSARLEERYKNMPGVIGKVSRPIEAVYEGKDVLHKEMCSQENEQILFGCVRRSDPAQRSLHSYTTQAAPAASSKLPETSTPASSDTVSKNKQGRRSASLAERYKNMRPIKAVYEEGDAKQRQQIMNLRLQMNTKLLPSKVMLPLPILPRPDFQVDPEDYFSQDQVLPRPDLPRVAKTVPKEHTSSDPTLPRPNMPRIAKIVPGGHRSRYETRTTVPSAVSAFEMVKGKIFKTVMVEPAGTLLSALLSNTDEEEPAESSETDSEGSSDEEMEDDEQSEEASLGPDCYPAGEFPFVPAARPLIKVEEPEDVKPAVTAPILKTKKEVVIPRANYQIREVKQEIDDTFMEESPSMFNEGVDITPVAKHRGPIIDEIKSLSPIPHIEPIKEETGGWMPKDIPWGQMIHPSTDSFDVKPPLQQDKLETTRDKEAKPFEHETSQETPLKIECDPIRRPSLPRAAKRTRHNSPCSTEVALFLKPAKRQRLLDERCGKRAAREDCSSVPSKKGFDSMQKQNLSRMVDDNDRPSTIDETCFLKPYELQRVLESDIRATRFERECSLPPNHPSENDNGSMRRRSLSRTAKTYAYNRLTAPCSAMSRIPVHQMTPELA